MYPYHNKIKSRIRNGELLDYWYEKNYPKIGECMVLFFSTPPHKRPIRPYRYEEYRGLLNDFVSGNTGAI